MKSLDIVFALNDAYMLPLATCIHSIGKATAAPYLIRLHVLHISLSSASIAYLTKVAIGCGMHIHFTAVSYDAAHGFPVSGHVSSETYLRLLAADLIHEAGRFVYLDCDTLVLSDPCGLASLDLAGAHLAAAPHPALRSAFFASERGIATYRQYGIAPDAPVFNAGVMVIDAALWRHDRISAEAANYLRAHYNEVRWWDQDALNIVLNRKWTRLPYRWNVMTSQYNPPFVRQTMTIDLEVYQSTIADPGIIHYTSASKPWMSNYIGLFGDVWHAADSDRRRTFPPLSP